MKVGDLIWATYNIYSLPKQGIVIDIINDFDNYYVILIEDEIHTLTLEEVFPNESEALKYQITVLRESMAGPLKK